MAGFVREVVYDVLHPRALQRVLLEELQDEGGELWGVEGGQGLGVLVHDVVAKRDEVIAVEGRLQG